MDVFMGESSSDEEYFPTAEELEILDEDEEMDPTEDEEDNDPLEEDQEEEEEEDEEDDEGADVERIILQNNPGLLRQIQQVLQHGIGLRSSPSEDPSRRRRRRLQDLPTIPYTIGKKLVNSGEFGTVDDSIAKKRRFEGARNINQFARYREMGWRRDSTLAFTRKWLPIERRGRIVAQYDRHVYSGQFSHDGSFFYTASQDFKCRMYSTLNPSIPKDWKLYKVFPSLSPTPFAPVVCSCCVLVDTDGRLFEGKLEDGQLQMLRYLTIIDSWHIHQ
jgi:hypothetical protein